jgi:hypothetical protein
MIKVIRARSIDTGDHQFSVVVSDKGITYVFPTDREMFNSKKRVDRLVKMYGPKDKDVKLGIDEYLSLAFIGLTYFDYDEPIEVKNENIAVSSEKKFLDAQFKKYKNPESYSSTLIARSEDVYQVFEDYPDLYLQLLSTNPDQKITESGMTELFFAAMGPIDPSGPNAWMLGDEEISHFSAVVAAVDPDTCPPATQDIVLNIKNRQNAIDNVGYGPLNPEEPTDEFWQGKADRWNTTIEDAKSSRCGNCAVFIQTSRMLDCIATGLQQGDKNVEDSYDVVAAGDLGYCEALDFKCAAARTCDAWVAGGPVTDETGKEQE